MPCCLNPDCPDPLNPDGVRFCQSCGTPLVPLLRGRYRIIRPLGRGGFGVTYLAEDEERRNAICVVKQFAPAPPIRHNSNVLAKAEELFNREAEQLLQLGDHSQIPTLFAFFEQENSLYLVQQFIQGQNLQQELKQQGAFDEIQIAALLNDLLPVLQFVHQHHVVHRDIKPDNLMRRHSDRKLVLIDFGISRQIATTLMSGHGTTAGTPGFATAEQLRRGKVYPASDLYSLGVTCIYLLTGKQPIELYDDHQERWLWRDDLARTGRTISTQLGTVLDRLLQEQVKDRYQSAEHVLADLNLPTPLPPSVTPPLSGAPPAPVSPPPAKIATTAPAQPMIALTKHSLKTVLLGMSGALLVGLSGYWYSQFIRTLTAPVPAISQSPDASQSPETLQSPIASSPDEFNYSGTPLFTDPPSPNSPPDPKPDAAAVADVPLTSAAGVDYSRLRDLLAAGDWYKADYETQRQVGAVIGYGTEFDGFINTDNLDQFPCNDLQTIDQLWVAASGGHYGFSVQHRIWQDVENQRASGYLRFAEVVGWRQAGRLVYSHPTFDSKPPAGFYPHIWTTFTPSANDYRYIEARVEQCQL
jgi:serine/threonine protein kinase